MPLIRYWFTSEVLLDWEETNCSPVTGEEGEMFFTYPAWWLVPYPNPSREEVEQAPSPLWIRDIHSDAEVGKISESTEGSYIISLPKTYEEYLHSIPYRTRKKFRYLLRKNEDLTIRMDDRSDFEALWPFYVDRIQELHTSQGYPAYLEEEIDIRKRFYSEPKIELLTLLLNEQPIAVNVSYRDGDTLYDLACFIRPTEEARSRSLGTVVVLKNIEHCISASMSSYDMLSENFGYKTSFGAVEKKLKTYIRCTKEFALQYEIPLEEVSELIGKV